MTTHRRLASGARRINVKPSRTPLPRSPHRMTFSDALDGAAYLVRAEHAPGPPCDGCKATLALLKQTEKALAHMALGDNLVWPALKASARACRPRSGGRKRRVYDRKAVPR